MNNYKINKTVLARNIKNIRLELGLNQEQFGKLFTPNADKSIVSRWELGKSVPNASRLKTISKKGNITMMFLTTGKESAKDLTFDDLTEHGKKIKKDMILLDTKHDNLYDTTINKYNSYPLTYIEKDLLINATRIIQLLKGKPNSNEAIGLLSSIISAPIHAKVNNKSETYFNDLKQDETNMIKDFIQLVQHSEINNLNDINHNK
ncbi:helix-turn-helix domain-containing protein [Companilactobacillus farciminis]|uniref:helix-turn-helix domain-containing protein n=1 Tax=Companilactobacillus farciminis TaxID=1612 RepID=UPI0034D77133